MTLRGERLGPAGRLLAAVALALTLAACGWLGDEGPTPEETTLTKVGDLAPDFEVVTLDGQPFKLSDQRGKVVLVNFFATWCPPCREELPHLEKEVWQKFTGDNFSLVVLGREEDESVLRPFLDETEFTFPVAPDPDRAAFSKYASQYIPRNVVIDPEGTIIF